MGLTTALKMAERGSAVTVIEASASVAPPSCPSYCNGTILCPSMVSSWACTGGMYKNKGETKKTIISKSAFLQPEFYRWAFWFWFNSLMPGRSAYNHTSCWELCHYSMICMEQEIERYGAELEFNRTSVDTLKLYHNEEAMQAFLTSNQAIFWKSKGQEFEKLTIEQCYELEPALADNKLRDGLVDNSDLVGGVRCKGDSSGDIYIYCKNLEKKCRSLGVDFQCGKKVEGLMSRSGEVTGVRLEDGGVVTGDTYVISAGVRSSMIAATAGVNLPIYPLKGHMVTVTSSEGQPILKRNIFSPKHGIIGALSPNELRISGGVEAVGYDYTVEEEKGWKLLNHVEGALKEGYLDKSQPRFNSGLRPVCGDDVPIIGQTHIPNLYVNTGHGSKGWTFCFGSAALLTQIMCGERTALDLERYSPLRFHPVRRLFAK